MENKAFQPDIYLERIHHLEHVPLSEAGLADLHRAQVCTIPFENFGISLNVPYAALPPLQPQNPEKIRSIGF